MLGFQRRQLRRLQILQPRPSHISFEYYSVVRPSVHHGGRGLRKPLITLTLSVYLRNSIFRSPLEAVSQEGPLTTLEQHVH
jgi:hypothetical protein